MFEEMFDEDSQNLASRLKKSVPGRDRISGTSNSPKSKELFKDQHVDDYNNEVFDNFLPTLAVFHKKYWNF